ncbi:PPC domain-containing protein [bacterium]|nr:PPC domain-containing protein [bacterium]
MRTAFSAAAIMLLVGASTAIAASPTLTVIVPRGVQRGTERVLTFTGARLKDAEEIFFYKPGFKVTKIEPVNNNSFKATIQVSAGCDLGEHTAQVRTKSGISEYRTFFVGALPAVAEKEPNSLFAEPQAISANVTVEGVVQAEDVDYFTVDCKKGERLSLEIEGMRFGQTLFDPYIAVLDSRRFEVKAVDDSPLVRQDAVCSVIIPEDGTYTIEVRESGYGGNGNCRYRLHVGHFPRPIAVFPAGGKRGEKVDVKYIGDASGDIAANITVPKEDIAAYAIHAQDDKGISPTGNPFRISDHGNAFEAEPNNSRSQATTVELPLAFNGILQQPEDIDFFKFAAQKGKVYEVECYGRRIRSAVDPVMNLYDTKGKGLAGSDDSRGPDSYFRFTVPADGEYTLRVTDHLKRGGPEFVYRVELTEVRKELTLGIPRNARYSQLRQQIYVPRGNRFATVISASRKNFGGNLVLEPGDLPAGIKMVTKPEGTDVFAGMPSFMNTMPVVFEAAADAPLGGKLINFQARHEDPKQNIIGNFRNRADFVIAQPGQSLYAWKDVQQLSFAVIDELPFHLEIVQPKVPIVKNGSMLLKIIAKKKKGWDEQIDIQFPFRPPGIGATSRVRMKKGQNECLYTLSANSGARVGKWPIYAIGSANVSGTAWVASQMAMLEVEDPFVGITLQRTNVEQGKDTEVFAKVEIKREFAGNAKVELLGLPNKVTTTVLEANKDTKELVFKVKTDKKSPAGAHKNVFCRVTVTKNAEPIIHARTGKTELRIDKPLPPKKNAPPKPAAKKVAAKKPAPAKAAPEKRLSRLEKLRLEAKKRAEGGGDE